MALKTLIKTAIQWLKRSSEETCYGVNRDGRLVLDKEALLRSGRMNRQFQAARQMGQDAGCLLSNRNRP